MLKVIHGTKKEKPDYQGLYRNAFVKKACDFAKSKSKDDLIKLIFVGVKYVGYMNNDDSGEQHAELIQIGFNLITMINQGIGYLTPRELIQIFPIDKEYDGDKYQSKDYFYTMERLKKYGLDKPIGDNVTDVLWDYMNLSIRHFEVKSLCILSSLRRLEGKKGIMEEFAEDHGLATYTFYKDSETQKEYIQNNQTGEIQRARRKIPRYLKAVK